jgi:glycosyltransferase involved in cell wall biosynthesis
VRILFDMRPLQKALFRGIGYYCMGLIEGLAANEDVEMGYLLDHWRAALPPGLPPGPRYFSDRLESLDEHYDVFIIGNVFTTLYYVDAYEYLVPARVREKVGLVASVAYDMITWIERDRELRWPSLRRKFMEILSAMKRFDHIFCISEATREDVVEYAGVQRSLTSVIYGSTNPGTASPRGAYDFSGRANAVVYVGGSFPRKNVNASIEGFAAAYHSGRIPADSQYFLVFRADDISVVRRKAEAEGVGGQVVATGFLSDAALSDLVSRCKSTVFPSLYEGLGMPVLESYRLDTPCFVGDNSSLKEIAPPECRFDASRVESIADMFVAALTDKGLCDRSISWGRSVAAELTWEKVGKKAYGILDGLVRARAELHRSDRVFVRGAAMPSGLVAALNADPGRFACVGNHAVTGLDALPRYSAEFLSRGSARLSPVADLYVLEDGESAAIQLREAARPGSSSSPRLLYLGGAAYPHLLFALAGNDVGRLRAMLFGAYAGRIAGLDAIRTLPDLVGSGIPCVAPIVSLVRPQALVFGTAQALETARTDLDGVWEGAMVLAPTEAGGLYETVAKAVSGGA